MTFKKSFMANLKNRSWVVAMTVLIALLQFGFVPALYFGSVHMRQVAMGVSGAKFARAMQRASGEWFSASLVLGIMSILFLAAVIGIQAFAYLYKTNSVDFYDSQPVSFRSRFFTNYLCGLLLFVVVFACGTVLEMAIVAAMGGGSLNFYLSVLERSVWFLALYAGTYSVAVLAAVLSGNVFIAFLLGCFLSGAEFLCRIVIFGCMNAYFTTIYWRSDIRMFPESLPLTHYIRHIGNFMNGNVEVAKFGDILHSHMAESVRGLLACGIIILVATALAYIAYVRRPREAAGKGLCFPFVESVVKLTMGICGGTLAGMIADGIFNTQYRFSLIMCLIVAVVVTLIGVVAEWVFNLNIAKSFRRGWQIPACFVVSCVLLVVFKQDLVGYDHYLPSPETVESCAFYPMDNYGYTVMYEDADDIESMMMVDENMTDYLEKYLILTDVDAVENIAKVGMELQREYSVAEPEYTDSYAGMPAELRDSWNAVVLYRLKSGKNVYRSIRIPYTMDRKAMDAVLGSKEYRQAYFNTDKMPETLQNLMQLFPTGELDVSYSNKMNGDTEEFLYADVQRLLKAYKQDLEQYDFTYTQKHKCLGLIEVAFEIKEDWTRKAQVYPVFDSYDRTIALLKKMDIYSDAIPKLDAVDFVGVQYTEFNGDEEAYSDERTLHSDTKIYRDADEVAQILAVLDETYYGEWARTNFEDTNYTATVVKKGDMENSGFTSKDEVEYVENGFGMMFTIPPKQEPAFLKKDFKAK